jgi:hypothetical protein
MQPPSNPDYASLPPLVVLREMESDEIGEDLLPVIARQLSRCSGPITSSAGTDYIGGFGTTLIENI